MTSTEYGVFNDEGCLEAQLYSSEESSTRLLIHQAGDRWAFAAAMCPDHPEQPHNRCEACQAGAGVSPASSSKYPTATICGTMKLFPQMLTVADELTRQGYIVLLPLARTSNNSPAVSGRVAQLERRHGQKFDHGAIHLNATPISAEELHEMHRAKIDRADLVVIVTGFTDHVLRSDSHDLYFGESTTAEMEYTRQLGTEMKLARVSREEYRDTIVWLSLVDAASGDDE